MSIFIPRWLAGALLIQRHQFGTGTHQHSIIYLSIKKLQCTKYVTYQQYAFCSAPAMSQLLGISSSWHTVSSLNISSKLWKYFLQQQQVLLHLHDYHCDYCSRQHALTQSLFNGSLFKESETTVHRQYALSVAQASIQRYKSIIHSHLSTSFQK